MSKVCIPIRFCNAGDVLAEEIYNKMGVTLVAKSTVINEYIRNKLIEMDIPNVWIYQPAELLGHEEKMVAKNQVDKTYKNTIMAIKQFLYELSLGYPIDYHVIKELSGTIYKEIDQASNIIQCLNEIKSADEYTYTHCVNVAFYSMLTAKWMNLPGQEIEEIVQAGLLHDVGKTKVPIEILNKNGKLTTEEFEIMKEHPRFGYEMLKDIDGIGDDILVAVLQHHERIDGSGYPDKLRSEKLNMYAKIIAVADVYDAMTQNRVYKKKVSPFESFQMFLTTGISSYDTTVLSAFIKHLAVYYVGAKVLLNNGEIGEIVYVPPQDITCPVINIGSTYIDLSKEREVKVVEVV
jgi:putative nucleotidyltransferase with HDIG domain